MTEVLINGKWPLKVPDHKTNQAWWDVWEKERLQAMHDTIKPGDTIFDIGAEEGDFSALFQKWAGKDGGLVLIEPSVRMWPCIKGIWEANGLDAPRAAYQVFCGARIREGTSHCGINTWPPCANGEISPEPGFNNILEHPEMTVLTIDQLANIWGIPDVVSIDCEGAEFEIMKGAIKTMEKQETIFFISVHPAMLEHDYGYTDDDFDVFMKNNGYLKEVLAIQHEVHICFSPST
ncbi:MAG TPA: hypothetical protein DD730_03370 [Desulfosporosinus sp.]|jgi:FkbM family methyltransferase|nr:hypothetical protein [Desulfosporosinus sp.]